MWRSRTKFIILLTLLFITILIIAPHPTRAAPPTIHTVTTNLAGYPTGEVPRYDKFEISFQVDTVAANPQLPYDAAPPNGVTPEAGITVNAHFTPDNWQTVFIQPAFYYQAFQDEVKSGQEWFYPTGEFVWKVRFAPDQPGEWQYKLVAEDAGGITETAVSPFTVSPSTNKGFIRVSNADSRYFEYDDGSYFPALGYNLNYRRVDWVNPVLANEASFQAMSANGIQLVRTWLSQWSIYGSAWNPWRSHNPDHQNHLPNPRLRHDGVIPADQEPLSYPGSETFLWLSYDETVFDDGRQWNFNPCMVLGWESPLLPVQRDTDYRLRVRYRAEGLTGPQNAGQPFGFAVKSGNWLWHNSNESQRCYTPGVGTLRAATYSTTADWSNYPDPDHPEWRILEGHFNSGDQDFLDRLYLVLENVTGGNVLVDHVWLEEELSNGQYGPNLIYKPWMAHHYYFDQRNSFALDKLLDLAAQYDIYLKLVILEKQDYALNIFELDGSLSTKLPHQQEQRYRLFYGDGRELGGKTKTRWLQEAWWRYLQARWGYSPHIHSWELLNEGDPGSTLHYILADELGEYMQTAFLPTGQTMPHPNRHLVTTSFWNNFPNDNFWGNDAYPYVDYADVHHYAQESSTSPFGHIYETADFDDAALFSQKLSMVHGADRPDGPDKPVMRGEVGWIFDGSDLFAQNAPDGVWLHNFIWAGINAGGLIESYWVGAPTQDHVYEDGSHNHRTEFKPFANFISTAPLNNGRYRNANPTTSHPNLRAWGQQDAVAGQAHLWIQNSQHTWRNVTDGGPINAVSGNITLTGFQSSETYTVQWWDTNEPDPAQQITSTELIVAAPDGSLTLAVTDLTADTAVKIFAPYDVRHLYLPAVLRPE